MSRTDRPEGLSQRNRAGGAGNRISQIGTGKSELEPEQRGYGVGHQHGDHERVESRTDDKLVDDGSDARGAGIVRIQGISDFAQIPLAPGEHLIGVVAQKAGGAADAGSHVDPGAGRLDADDKGGARPLVLFLDAKAGFGQRLPRRTHGHQRYEIVLTELDPGCAQRFSVELRQR